MSDFLTAVGLLFMFEGCLYGGFPSVAKRIASDVLKLPESVLRYVGMGSMVLGLGMVWLVRS